MTFSDKIAETLNKELKKEKVSVNKLSKKKEDLQDIEKTILKFCSRPRNSSDVVALFPSRGYNILSVLQNLVRKGFIENPTDKYITKVKYRNFEPVMTMNAARELPSDEEITEGTTISKTREGVLFTYYLPNGDAVKQHYMGYDEFDTVEERDAHLMADFIQEVKNSLNRKSSKTAEVSWDNTDDPYKQTMLKEINIEPQYVDKFVSQSWDELPEWLKNSLEFSFNRSASTLPQDESAWKSDLQSSLTSALQEGVIFANAQEMVDYMVGEKSGLTVEQKEYLLNLYNDIPKTSKKKQAGGGAGIVFDKVEVIGTANGVVSPKDWKFKVMDLSDMSIKKFNAHGYNDGMSDVKGSLLKIYSIDIDGTEAKDYIPIKYLEDLKNEEELDFQIDGISDLRVVKGAGWVRSTPTVGDTITFENANISVSFYAKGKTQSIGGADLNGSLTVEFPEEFIYFYEDVFNPYFPSDEEIEEYLIEKELEDTEENREEVRRRLYEEHDFFNEENYSVSRQKKSSKNLKISKVVDPDSGIVLTGAEEIGEALSSGLPYELYDENNVYIGKSADTETDISTRTFAESEFADKIKEFIKDEEKGAKGYEAFADALPDGADPQAYHWLLEMSRDETKHKIRLKKILAMFIE